MDVRTARVHASHLIVDVGGVSIGPGQPVDLDAEIAPGVTIRHVFPEEYFETVEQPDAPALEPEAIVDEEKD